MKTPAGEFALDPDEQAQSVIRLVFDEFDRQGSVRRVFRYLQANDIKLPVRPHKGTNKGMLEWRRATRGLTRTVLTHPLYAGTYRYGRRPTDQRRKQSGKRETGRIVVEQEQYHALIHDHCPAYITRERYERNQEKIQSKTDHVDISLHWSGGFNSHHELVRPVLGYEQMADYNRLVERIEELRGEGKTFADIAEHLNREGFRPAQQAAKFHKDNSQPYFSKTASATANGERDRHILLFPLASYLLFGGSQLAFWICHFCLPFP